MSVGNAQVTASPTNVSISANLAELKMEQTLVGNQDGSGGLGMAGRAVGGTAGYGLSNSGFRAEAIAYLLQGDAYVKIHIFGLEGRLGVKGCAGCAGGAVGFGMTGQLQLAAVAGGGLFWDLKLK